MKGKKTNVVPAIPQKADGGGITEAGGNPKVFAAARKRKFGGRAGIGGLSAKPRLDRPRPGRKLGGKVGAVSAPLSSAHSS